MVPRSLRMDASNMWSLARISAAVSAEMAAPVSAGCATSIRSSCRRVRWINANPSAYVAVAGFSPNVMTLAAGMMTSRNDGLRKTVSASQIMPKRIVSAKQIYIAVNSRRKTACDISAQHLWRSCNFYFWCTASKLVTKSRTHFSGDFPFELCKGDLSIRLFSSRACGVFAQSHTIFSAQKARP